MSDFVWELDAVGRRITSQHGIPATVEHTGGNVATLFVGARGHRIAVGPGWFCGTRIYAAPDDMSMAPEDNPAVDPVSLADAVDVHDLIGRIVDAWSELGR